MENDTKKKTLNTTVLVHTAFITAIILCSVWVYNSIAEKPFVRLGSSTSEHIMKDGNHNMEGMNAQSDTQIQPSEGVVDSRDDAVRSYLDAAQILAEIYKFNNNGSYAGLCERSEDMYTLEGESGGILKYIKFVGATEVFCSTGDESYMIEAKMPESSMFYCIDNTGSAKELADTSEGRMNCL